MTENQFHVVADATLSTLSDTLEEADASGALDVECASGVMTISKPDRKQWVVSKHAPSQQLWLSSPVSGGLHFSYSNKEWMLADGRTLSQILLQELGVEA